VLTAERSIGKFHVVWSLYVIVRESERAIVPGIIGVLEPRTKVNYLGARLRIAKAFANQHIIALSLENDGNRLWQVEFGVPAS